MTCYYRCERREVCVSLGKINKIYPKHHEKHVLTKIDLPTKDIDLCIISYHSIAFV